MPGEPLPPLLEIPARIEDLAASQVGAQLVLTWSRPRLTTEGTTPQRLDRIEIYATFYADGEQPADVPSDQLAVVPVQGVPDTQDRMRHTIELATLRLPQRAVIAVKAVNDRGRDAGFSNVVTLPIVDLPQPPANLQGEVTERAVRLSWRPAERSAFGGATPSIDGYEIFRREAGTPEPGVMIGEAQSTEYADTSFAFEQTYVYAVRAFVRRDGATAVTPFSAPAEIAVLDTFPPAAPEDLRVVAGPGGIEISWNPNEEDDLAGYHVYRSEGGEFERVSAEALRIPAFRDQTARPEARYRYHVRATDRKGNESRPSEPVEVTAE